MSKNILKEKTQYIVIGVILIIVAVVLVVMMLLQGQSEVSGEIPEPVKSEAMSCTSKLADYPILTYHESETEHEITVNLLFNNDEIKTIGLFYNVAYGSETAAGYAKSFSQAEMNKALAAAGYKENGALNNRFSSHENVMSLSLYAEKDDIVDKAAPFLLITTGEDGKNTISKKAEFRKNYANLGFTCKES